MNLTPIPPDILPAVLAGFAARLAPGTPARAAFDRIAASAAAGDGAPAPAADSPARRADARALVRHLGMAAIEGAPADGFSWDGAAVRVDSEAAVLIHEAAHWLIAPPQRRALPDFGLGAGPETGRVAEADAACCVALEVKAAEELLASLLGILWEAALGHPAIHSFIEQNWLEAWDRPAAAAQFARTVDDLLARGLIDGTGRPCADGAGVPQPGSAATAAISIRNSGQASAETSTMAEAGPSAGK